MGVELREYTALDLAFIRGLFVGYLEEERARVSVLGIEEGFSDRYLSSLVQKVRSEQGLLLIAEADGERAGFIAVLPKEPQPWDQSRGRVMMVMELHVAPAHRRRGIGRRLFEEAEQRFRARGVVWSTLGTFAGNSEAHAFYAALGYRPTYLFLGKHLGSPDSPAPPRRRGETKAGGPAPHPSP